MITYTHLRRWNNGECIHDTVRELFSDLGDEQCSKTRSGATTKGVGQLETLQAIAVLCLLPNNIENAIDQLRSFSVMTLGPVVSSTALTCNAS